MKKLLVSLGIACFFVFSAVAQYEASRGSAQKYASFDVFTNDFDNVQNPLYWQKNPDSLSVYPGLNNNFLNGEAALTLSETYYIALAYTYRISNYKYVWDNMTDEEVNVFFGLPHDIGIHFVYFDYCISAGHGILYPGLEIGKTWALGSQFLRTQVGSNLKFVYPAANDYDVLQLESTVKIDYGVDRDNGIGFTCTYMPTFKGNKNITDVSRIDPVLKTTAWFGKVWNPRQQYFVGVHPTLSCTFNPVDRHYDTTYNNYNYFPANDEFEFALKIPVAVAFALGASDRAQLILSLMFGMYYLSFHHYDFPTQYAYVGEGGRNYRGWVPQSGVGIGLHFAVSEKCTVQIGTKFVWIPEVRTIEADEADENNDGYWRYGYQSKNASLSSLFDNPLCISIQFRDILR